MDYRGRSIVKLRKSIRICGDEKMAKLIEITGKALSGEWGNDDNTGNGIPVLRTTNFTNEGIVNYNNVVTRIIEKKKIEEKYLRKGDIIIEKSGGSDKQPVGRVVYFDGPENTYLFNNFTGLLRVKDQAKWYPRYVFYSLFSNYHRGGTRAFQNKTTGLHNLKIDDFVSRCEVTEAGINEQIAACKQMDRVNDIIRMHQQQLQKLDELVKARFVELFGPCQSMASMDELCSIITDGTHQPPKFHTDGIPFIFVSNLVKNTVTYNAEKFISEETYSELYKRTPIEVGDLLLSTVGSYGHPAVVVEDRKFLFQRHIAYLKPKRDIVNSFYLHAALLSPDSQRQIEEKVKGIAQKTLNLSEIRKILIPLPSIEDQNAFEVFVKQTDKSKVAVQKALDEAQLLFDSLMQKYFG